MSPIYGLTDGLKSLREIGRLRKGAPKTEGLRNLTYFRPDFRPGEEKAYNTFLEKYGSQPTAINIRLAFAQLDRCWDAFFTVYNSAGMLGKAGRVEGREGNWWIYLRDNHTGLILVKNALPEMEFDPSKPVYSYRSRKGDDVPVFARPEGKLHFLIPELKLANYVTLVTHSWYDIARIDGQLAGIVELASHVGLEIPMVPLVLTRKVEKVSMNIQGNKTMRDEWLINVDIRPDWVEAQFALLDTLLPGVKHLIEGDETETIPPLELPDGIHHEAGWAEAEEATNGSPANGAQTPPEPEEPHAPNHSPQPASVKTPAPAKKPAVSAFRPYMPELVKALIETRSAGHPKFIPTDAQLNLLRYGLRLCFPGYEEEKDLERYRHMLLKYLTGKESSKDVTGQEFKALVEDWLEVKQDRDTNEYTIGHSAEVEALRIVTLVDQEAVLKEGQKVLPGFEKPAATA